MVLALSNYVHSQYYSKDFFKIIYYGILAADTQTHTNTQYKHLLKKTNTKNNIFIPTYRQENLVTSL